MAGFLAVMARFRLGREFILRGKGGLSSQQDPLSFNLTNRSVIDGGSISVCTACTVPGTVQGGGYTPTMVGRRAYTQSCTLLYIPRVAYT